MSRTWPWGDLGQVGRVLICRSSVKGGEAGKESGLVGLYIKGMLAGKSFTTSRNALTLKRAVFIWVKAKSDFFPGGPLEPCFMANKQPYILKYCAQFPFGVGGETGPSFITHANFTACCLSLSRNARFNFCLPSCGSHSTNCSLLLSPLLPFFFCLLQETYNILNVYFSFF